MSDARDTAASSNRHPPDCWRRGVIESALRQLIRGISGLLLLLLIGVGALAFVITLKEHYDTTGAFIELMRLIATLYFGLAWVMLLIMAFFIYKLGSRIKTP